MENEVVKLKPESFTLVPTNFRVNDPRQTAYNFADTIRNSSNGLVVYNKQIARFIYYCGLHAAEQVARAHNQILVPTTCLHWRRAKDFARQRVLVGRKAFYALYPDDLKSSELIKLLDYLDEEGIKYDCTN